MESVRRKRPPVGSPPHDLAPGSFWFSPWVGQRHPWVFSSSAGLGDGAAPCGSQHLLLPHGPPVWGYGRRPQPLQGRPRSSVGAGEAWRAAPSPAVSLRPGPPSPAWLCPRLISVSRHHAVCPPPSWVLCSYEEFYPCSFWGFSFRKKPDSAGGHSQGFMASKGFCGFGSELTFVRILLGCEFHQH